MVSPGDRVIVIYEGVKTDSPFYGWGTATEGRSMLSFTKDHVYVNFDHIPPNNTYGYPPDYVKPLLVIEEIPWSAK